MIRVFSQKELLVRDLVDRIQASVEVGQNSNMIVQYELGQLIRYLMRELACAGEEDTVQKGILSHAIDIVETEIETRVGETALHFDLGLDSLRQKHQFTAREMTMLRERLLQARQTEVVRPPRVVTDDTEVPFRILDLGSRDTLEGLIAQVLVDECHLNLERTRQDYDVQGEWLPLQIMVELDGAEIACIVTDDGSILTFLAGYPAGLVEQARWAIERLARLLYAAPT